MRISFGFPSAQRALVHFECAVCKMRLALFPPQWILAEDVDQADLDMRDGHRAFLKFVPESGNRTRSPGCDIFATRTEHFYGGN
jgi:hypothetical protein